jgi:heme oxygenase
MSKNDAISDPMLELRKGTQDLHSRIEASPNFSGLMKEQVKLGDYVQALELLTRFYANREPQILLGMAQYFPDFNYISRLPLLNRDLRKLGVLQDDTPVNKTISVPSKAETLGLLYVVEGSALGGQIISRHLEAKLGLQISDAMRFYTLDGKMLSGHWANVKRLFRENLKNSEEIDQAVFSARAAFNSLLS